MLKIQAMEIIGGDLSATTKMPCKSFNCRRGNVRPAASLQKFPALCAMVAMP
jgi:hypothetical protein